jgi:phosphatidylserine/phosphatidylglycerophosphate/cardiolipin synthase-like enzyme
VKLLVQPGDGVQPLIRGINAAKQRVQIAIFRFDQPEIERALANAVNRGVEVHALIAHTNRAGEENLRKLEQRLLGAGATVARTSDDLARYHGKLMIIDSRELYLLAFNLTYADVERSRSFGLVIHSRELVREAARLFDADARRHPYEAENGRLVVSPLNARKMLAAFIKSAKKDLLIYDPKVSDPAMIRLLADRAAAGVQVRIIGRLTRKSDGVAVRKLLPTRLHTRTMIRDGSFVFMGSQSLRELELDARREVGVIVRDVRIAARLRRIFEEDWSLSAHTEQPGADDAAPTAKIAKKVAKAVTKDLPPVAPLLNGAVKELVGGDGRVELNAEEVEQIVKGAVKEAVKEAVRDVVEEVVEHQGAAE